MARKVTIRRGLKADLPILDIGELGYAIDTEELFIGSESSTNVLFAKKSELNALQEQIDEIKQSAVFTRLGVSENGLLTIDGLEQQLTGGGSSDMTLVVKDYFEGSTNITKTYTDNMVGFTISNDAGVSGGTLTFTINGITIPVKAAESYEANFIPFKSVIINSTVPYRATVSAPYGATFDTIAPLNVSGLTTSNITTSDLTLSWVASTSSDTVGYEVYQGSTLLATITETTYNVTGLNPSTSYTYKIKAKDNSGNVSSGVSVTVSTLADTTAPNNVTNLVASNVLATSLALSWTASTSSDVTGYEIYNGSNLITTVTGTTYTVTGLTTNTNYTFTIKAKDGFNNVATGSSVSVTTANVDITAPFDVTGLTAGTSTVNSIPVGWTLSSSSDVVNYEVAYSSNGGSTYTVVSSVVNSSSTSFTITGLTVGTTYTIRVVAIDTSGNRSTGATVVKATASNTTYTVSASPSSGTYNATQNVTLSVNPTGATIYYTTNGTTPTTSSSVYSNPITVSANTTIKFFAQDGSGNATSVQTATYTIDSVAPTVTISPVAGSYNSTQSVTITSNETSTIYFTVDGTSPTTGSSVYSTPISVSATQTIKYLVVDTAGNQTTGSAAYIIDAVSPDSVTALSVGSVTYNSIPVTWTAPTATDVSKYEVAYSSDGGTNYTLATSSLSVPANSYTVTGLVASTTYTIRVVAIDAAGNRSIETTVVSTTSTPPQTLINDDFNRTNSTTSLGTSLTGQSWSALAGTWGVNTNKAYMVSGTNGVAVVDAGTSDVDISTDITWGSEGTLVLRGQDSTNYLFLRLKTNQVQFYEMIAGSAKMTFSYNTTLTSGQVYTLRAVMRGSEISCYLNGTKVFDAYSVQFPTATKFGFRQAASTTDRYDNFVINQLTALTLSNYVVYDSFDRADSATSLGNTDTGQTWNSLIDVWGISSKLGYNVSDNSATVVSESVAVIDSGIANANIEVIAPIMIAGGSATRNQGIVFRASDAENYLYFRYSSAGKWQLLQYTGNTYTELAFFTEATSAIVPSKLKVVANGSSIECFANGVSKLTATSTFNQTATKHGIGAISGYSANTKFDNFNVTNIA